MLSNDSPIEHVPSIAMRDNHTVFLGGSCNPTTWRKDIAIPILRNHNISFYDPQVDNWTPDLIQAENLAKQNAEVLFFVIDNKTRAISAMIEASFIAAFSNKLILVIDPCPPPLGAIINDEPISEKEHEILKRGRHLLRNLVEGKQIPVFDDILEALSQIPKLLDKHKVNFNGALTHNHFSRLKSSFNCDGNKQQVVVKKLQQVCNKLMTLDTEKYSQPYNHLHTPHSGHKKRSTSGLPNLQLNCSEASRAESAAISGFDQPDGVALVNSVDPVVCMDVAYRFDNRDITKRYQQLLNATDNELHSQNDAYHSRIGDDQGSGKYVVDNFYRFIMKQAGNFKASLSLPSLTSVSITRPSITLSSPSSPPILSACNIQPSFPSYETTLNGLPEYGLLSSCKQEACNNKYTPYKNAPLSCPPKLPVYDIYLGGSYHEDWREKIAIPNLKKHGLTFYSTENPRSMVDLDFNAISKISSCRILLFFIDNEDPSLETMILAGHFLGLKCHVVMCIQMITEDKVLKEHQITKAGLNDYNRGRKYLSDFVKREGGKVFSSIHDTVKYAIEWCKLHSS
ncbi:NDT-like domain-containing protein raw [Brevipalpus obovatus]|uniref:NDT-like domain-containing protein raw n=1 Tax=Brevipalpus obovatus TaxID=246614 RepID=UPI003D9E879A